MPKASEIKKNMAVEYDGRVMIVRDIERSVPQGRASGSIYRMRMYDVVTGGKVDESFKAEDMLKQADLAKRPAILSYVDGDEYVFMDEEDYTPYHLNKASIEEQLLFIDESTKGLLVVLIGERAVSIDIPSAVDLVIAETSPSVRGASASARTKPATLTTGLVVQMPEHISTGDKIRINTAEAKFISRAD